jgi:hypothetical protein
MTEEPTSLILELLRQMRAELGDVRAEISQIRADMATKADLASLRADLHTLHADILGDTLSTRKALSAEIAGLHRTVMDYHATALRLCPSLRRLSAPVARTDGWIAS